MQARPDMAPNDVALLMAGLLPSSPAGTRALNDVCQAALDLTCVGQTTDEVHAWSLALLDLAKQDPNVKPALVKALSEGPASKVLRMQVAGSGPTDYVD